MRKAHDKDGGFQCALRLLLALITFASLTGCAALDLKRAVSEEDRGRFKRVGILSGLGPSMHVIYIGTVVFQNTAYQVNVDPWTIDELATRQVTKSLDARRIPSGPIALKTSVKDLYVDRREPVMKTDEVLKLADEQGYDAVLVIRRTRYDNEPFYEPGYGLFYRTAFGSARSCSYAMYVIQVFDVRSKESLGWERASACMDRPAPVSMKKYEEYSSVERELIKTSLQQGIQRSVEDTLKRLGY